MRAFWNGVISMGLVSVHVSLIKGASNGKPSLSTVCPSSHPITMKKFCAQCDQTYRKDEVKKAYFEGGRKWARRGDQIEYFEPVRVFTAQELEWSKTKSDKTVKVEKANNLPRRPEPYRLLAVGEPPSFPGGEGRPTPTVGSARSSVGT